MLIILHFLLQTLCVTALKIFLTRALFTAALDIMRYAAFVHDNVLESVFFTQAAILTYLVAILFFLTGLRSLTVNAG